jgi:hypothetical protein
MHVADNDRPALAASKIVGYVVLIILGIGFSLVTVGALGNVLGWLAAVAAIGFIGVPVYALATKSRLKQLPLGARVVFWLAVLASICFIVLMALVVFALSNNFS